MPIRIVTGRSDLMQMKDSFIKNRVHYLQEALGLAIFMISACFFSAMLFSEKFMVPGWMLTSDLPAKESPSVLLIVDFMRIPI
ncbi:MAG: hypothetical protein ACSLE0_04300 [Chitinophagaceae bacterium]